MRKRSVDQVWKRAYADERSAELFFESSPGITEKDPEKTQKKENLNKEKDTLQFIVPWQMNYD